MCIGGSTALRTIVFSLVVALFGATASFGATMREASSTQLDRNLIWSGVSNLGLGLATLSSALPARKNSDFVFAELPKGARQVTFSLTPALGASLTYGMEGRMHNSTAPNFLHRNILWQASEITGIRLRGRPISLFLHLGAKGSVHLTLNYRIRPAAAGISSGSQPLYRSPLLTPAVVVTANASPAAVPLPATLPMVLPALLALGLIGRKRRKEASTNL
ncbi:MAG: hypothetical protein WBA91_06895 [Paracoccaceae bacterium]